MGRTYPVHPRRQVWPQTRHPGAAWLLWPPSDGSARRHRHNRAELRQEPNGICAWFLPTISLRGEVPQPGDNGDQDYSAARRLSSLSGDFVAMVSPNRGIRRTATADIRTGSASTE